MGFDILGEIEARIQENRPGKKLNGMIIEMNKSQPHNSKRRVGDIERLEFR
jgi:hypothetical protein